MLGFKRLVAPLLAFGLFTGCVTSSTRESTAEALDEALANNQRSEEDRTRDRYRHPAQTLLFFGVRPQMSVLELWPERDGYTDALAPLLAARGKYYAAIRQAEPEQEAGERLTSFRQMLAARPDLYRHITVVTFPMDGSDVVAPGTLDLVVSSRNLHSWQGRDTATRVLGTLFRALKPGGAFGVVEKRSPAAEDGARGDAVSEGYAIALIESAGFRLVAESQVNARRADSTPPLTDPSSEGERFTLKFIKPLRAASR